MIELQGIPASPGIVIGNAFVYNDNELPELPRYRIETPQIELEWQRLQDAINLSTAQIKALEKTNKLKSSRSIFEAHIMMLEDPEYLGQIKKNLAKTQNNIEWVVNEVSKSIMQTLFSLEDSALRERAIDIADISRRILRNLLGLPDSSLGNLQKECIIVAHDLLPSELLTIDRKLLKGIAIDSGSKTSHVAILAKAFKIPAVLGLGGATAKIHDGDILLVNGGNGRIGINPGGENLEHFKAENDKLEKQLETLLLSSNEPALTLDGKRITLKANIGISEEAEQALRHGTEGIGLYRSEFLFLLPGVPAEEEMQFEAYKSVLETMKDKPVTIRTLDIGGDKAVPAFRIDDEKNPLLGWRAIRFCLACPDIFKTQLRALLRASVYGNLRIMFPMIGNLGEFETAVQLFNEAKDECKKKNQPFNEEIALGMMIEIPAAAVSAQHFTKKAAFFSIGTNDLLQYTLAVDRGNERVNYLAQNYHPAMLLLIKNAIDAAHQAGIPCSMCGELAGDYTATPLLLGLGLDEFSMDCSSIPFVKQRIRSLKHSDCKALADKALTMSRHEEVEKLINEFNA
ncbi:MAG: phosphoenolpyruvate--protein phosphotransferase [Spirochaetaceae bacterium]|jgi:phosphotransferase system enzyme I (PtsI)|nr:phosphoenolpyruvate--protein phosphotransferase [Spirochaetaceae bacterium]